MRLLLASDDNLPPHCALENQQRHDVSNTTPGRSVTKNSPLIPDVLSSERNGSPSLMHRTQQRGAVMMFYGLDKNTSNTDKVFNLVCLYGNVARVYYFKCVAVIFDKHKNYIF